MFELFADALKVDSMFVIFLMALIEVFKRAGLVKRWIPFTSVFIGIFLSWVLSGYVWTNLVGLTGAIGGLMACGIWDLVKVSFLGK